jgi:hypothetical protein
MHLKIENRLFFVAAIRMNTDDSERHQEIMQEVKPPIHHQAQNRAPFSGLNDQDTLV